MNTHEFEQLEVGDLIIDPNGNEVEVVSVQKEFRYTEKGHTRVTWAVETNPCHYFKIQDACIPRLGVVGPPQRASTYEFQFTEAEIRFLATALNQFMRTTNTFERPEAKTLNAKIADWIRFADPDSQ